MTLLQIVKFCRSGQDRVSPLSDVDVGVYQLQRSEKLLEERLQTMGEKADRYVSAGVLLMVTEESD